VQTKWHKLSFRQKDGTNPIFEKIKLVQNLNFEFIAYSLLRVTGKYKTNMQLFK